MKSTSPITVGFSIFLEHILPYKGKEEKAVMNNSPRVQLGGSAWNIAKTLETLIGSSKRIRFYGITSKPVTAQSASLAHLLNEESIASVLLPIKERVLSSYYLLPEKKKTWAFGDWGGKSFNIKSGIRKKLASSSRSASVSILAEVSDDSVEVGLAKIFLKKGTQMKKTVLIPSESILLSRRRNEVFRSVDLLSMNKKEAKIFFGKDPARGDVLKCSVPYVFITRGKGEAWLKVFDKLYVARPKRIPKPKFIGGAGDAATAALVYALFYKGWNPRRSLDFAMLIGRKTLQVPTSYLLK